MTTNLSIHTVYKPQENVMYLKEWLDYHTFIGADKFYIYDNAESWAVDHLGNQSDLPNKNKYGYDYAFSIKEARKIQYDIIKEYNIELIEWSPKDIDGRVVYGQVESMDHLASNKNEGLVAFIDVDEFIVKREEFRESRMLQVKYESRNNYKSVLDISKGFDEIRHVNHSSKCIIEMSRYSSPISVHFQEAGLPISESYFNHYNHNEVGHKWLINNYHHIDSSWVPKPYDKVFRTMPTLRELSGFAG